MRNKIKPVVLGEAPWPLVLLGPAGVGKSCAALALLDVSGGFYYTAYDLGLEVASAQHGRLMDRGDEPRPISQERLWKYFADAALIVLDELGSTAKVSSHHYECVKKLLDLREGKPLVVISNLGFESLGEIYDERITSRLGGGTVIKIQGEDRRLQR